MSAVKSKKFPQTIIFYSKQVNSTVLVVDKMTSVRFLDQQSLETLNGFKVNINHQWYKNQVVDYSYNGAYMAVISEDAKQSRLYDTRTKKVIIKINRHHGEVTCVAIDPKASYFFSGGEDGRTFVSDIKSSRLLFTLPSHADTINDIQFSKTSYLVATASYDKRVQVFNYATMTPLANLKGHNAPVMKVEFLDSSMLCSIDKNSSVIIWDLSKQKVFKRLSGIHDEIVQVSSNEKFLFLATALGFVIVYDTKTFEQVSRKFIKVSSRITFIEYDSEQDLLIIANESGELLYFDIYKGIKEMQILLESKSYDKVYSLLENNPLLEYTDIYKSMDDIWEGVYEKASLLLQKSKKDESLEVFGSFINIPSKKTLINKLFKDYEEFDKFLLMVKNEKLALAYSLVNKHPAYKKSEVYKAIEKKWRKLFTRAQEMSVEHGSKDKIKELLSPYRGVSEKTKHIQDMLVKSDIYTRFKNSIIKKDFKIVFELVKVNPFLKEFPEYFSVISFGDNLYIKINKFIQSGDIHKAIKLMKILVDFPDFKDEVNMMLKDIELRDKFYKTLEKSNFANIYKLIDTSSTLSNTPDGIKYNKLWNDDLDLSKVYALNGDIIGIEGVLDKYKDIPSKKMSIASIYSLAYITQIENGIRKKKDKKTIEKAFKSYILYFGLDDYIISTFEQFYSKYENVSLDLESLKKGSKKNWQPSVKSIDILE
ncbi:hypothetical protein FJR48_06195 [Sulfurimonas lithotrophica]|uniref:WD40 repeat, subgroup n=1 Tax=Sulfurimonas lithotrophica TaxID=2590022 RepID=A0A5P8P0X3_9BACT|nr:hypothetical protein [Sulfurimonas lithotrophica]QFR49339.1 hypothetical protein FJR48_06195 [Sulfurimonas lithotrophica]